MSTRGRRGAAPSGRSSLDSSIRLRHATVAGRRVRFIDTGSGPPIVFVHGVAGSWRSWLRNLPELAQDHRVIALDLPGFGGSDAFTSGATMSDYAGTVRALLTILGLERVVAVGHSMGGLVCERLSLIDPAMVGSLVLVCAGGTSPGTAHRRAACGLGTLHGVMKFGGAVSILAHARWLRCLIMGVGFHDPWSVPDELMVDMLRGFSAPGFTVAAAAALRDDIHQRLGEIASPTLVLWGRGDRLLPFPIAQELASLIPEAHLEIWDGVGHCPMLERPEAFNSRLRGWVSAHSPNRLRPPQLNSQGHAPTS